jgi:hypothetical protein
LPYFLRPTFLGGGSTHTPTAAEGVCPEERATSDTNVLTERKQVIARENITTKRRMDTKENQIEKKLRDLRVLRGRQV